MSIKKSIKNAEMLKIKALYKCNICKEWTDYVNYSISDFMCKKCKIAHKLPQNKKEIEKLPKLI
jgi:hypothetical protein